MSTSRTESIVLNDEFLPLRARILEIAAGLDRLDRAVESAARDPRRHLLERSLRVLLQEAPGRAEQVQLLFSREYDADWREDFGV